MDYARFLDAAIQVLVSNNGASLLEIAQAAGIGRATLHRHFTSRNDLLRAITLKAIGDAEQAVAASRIGEDSALDAVERVVHALMPIGHRYYFLLRISDPELEADRAITTAVERLTARLEQLLLRGQREGVLRADLRAQWLGEVMGVVLFAAWEGIRDGVIAPRDAPNLVLTTLLDGVGARPRPT